jgi:hypothetical protein
MGEVKDNYVIQGTTGRIGKLVVYKTINGKTFATKYPDRSNIKYTKEQIGYRKIFAEAAKFASEIVSDPKKKAAYPRHGKTSVYHSALKDFMLKDKEKKIQEVSNKKKKKVKKKS